MAISPIFNSFIKGEWDNKLDARADLEGYSQALKRLENGVIIPQGGAEKRSGTKFLAEVKSSSAKTYLFPFFVSSSNKFILEFGNNYIRFYKNDVVIGSPYEVATTYTTAELPFIRMVQVGNVLFIVHPNHKPASLTRISDSSWTLANLVFSDGPYRQLNSNSSLTLTSSASTGSATLTASSALFTSNDVGRYVRMEGISSTAWGWAEITAYTSSTQVTIAIKRAIIASTATILWRLGAYYTGNYPSSISVFENRLCLGNTYLDPQSIAISESGSFLSFSPSDYYTGNVLDSNGMYIDLVSETADSIQFLKGTIYGLIVGTVGGEYLIRSNSDGSALTPSTVSARKSNTYASYNAEAKLVSNSVFYIQSDGERVRNIHYDSDNSMMVSEDINMYNTTIAKPYISKLEYQAYPHSIVWAVRSDGALLSLSVNNASGVLGWSKQLIGGISDLAGKYPGAVEDVCVLDNEIYLVVKRIINNVVKRYIEKMDSFFDEETERYDLAFSDSYVKYNNKLSITGITKANPCVVSITSHGLSTNDYVYISDINGMTELNGKKYQITKINDDSFSLNSINSTSYTAYIDSGYVRKYVSVATGLSHLEGQEVAVYANGANQTRKTVTSGQITLDNSAFSYIIGLPYEFNLETMNNTTNSQVGTGQSKIKRINKITLRLYNSLGGKAGTDSSKLDLLYFRDRGSLMDTAPDLFTGDYDMTPNSSFEKFGRIIVNNNYPFPFILLGIIYKIEVTENS